MKDLYRRNNLKSGESNTVKIHGIESGFEEDREAAFAILLNQSRKNVYDDAHNTLKLIGRLRTQFDINTIDWKKINSDYVTLRVEKPSKKSKDTSDTVFSERPVPIAERSERSAVRPNTVNPTHNATYSSNSASFLNKYNSKFNALIQKFAWVCGISFFVVMLWLMFSDNHSGAISEDQEKINKYAVNRSVNVYSKPSMSEAVVTTLKKYDDVTVIPAKSKGAWDFVEVGENGAYILKEELAVGIGEKEFIKTCRESGVTRPDSSELSSYRPTGIHTLIISNPPGKDTLLKLKTSRGRTALFTYIRGGENLTLNNIAEGDYYVEFSIGDNYSPTCERFLDDAYAIRDQEPKYFTAKKEGFVQHPKTVSYVLKNEIFNTKRIPLSHF